MQRVWLQSTPAMASLCPLERMLSMERKVLTHFHSNHSNFHAYIILCALQIVQSHSKTRHYEIFFSLIFDIKALLET